MQKQIETMVQGIGDLSLDAIITWFPNKPKEIIMKEIEKSELVGIKGNRVMLKNKIEEKENQELVTRNINFVERKEIIKSSKVSENIKSRVSIKSSNNINYEELLELIKKYNSRIKSEYDTLIDNNFNNKREAVLEYYKHRFIVKEKSFNLGANSELYSLINKKTQMEFAYLYIGEVLTIDDFKRISEVFVDDTIYFCITKNSEVLANVSNREYYLKDIDSIVQNHLNRYKLSVIDCVLYKIDN